MDWADDVTYAVHDVEDWYRLGLIPLESLFQFNLPAGHPAASRYESPELTRFLDWLLPHWQADAVRRGKDAATVIEREELVRHLHRHASLISVVTAHQGTRDCDGRLQTTVSDLIGYFVDSPGYSGEGIGYNGALLVPSEQRLFCDFLKALVWFYVIERPHLAAQQAGQRRIVRQLVEWIHEDPRRLLPADRQEELADHGDLTRAVADHVASLTEPMAVKLHGKLSGSDLGAITDTI